MVSIIQMILNTFISDENDCKPDSCNHSGICRDELKHFTCSCYDRYNGTNCEQGNLSVF